MSSSNQVVGGVNSMDGNNELRVLRQNIGFPGGFDGYEVPTGFPESHPSQIPQSHESSQPRESLSEQEEQVDLVTLIDQPDWKTILYDLVRSNKMDPWNIDLVVLTEKFLQKISSLDGNDLRVPANAVLACAILLRFKSKILKLSSIEDEDELEEQQKEMTPEEKILFEQMLPELSHGFKEREGRVSLDALVNSIEKILEQSKKKSDNPNKLFDRPEFKLPMSDFDIEEKMKEVLQFIEKNVDSEGLILFSQVINEKNVSEIVEVFISTLFLANHQKIRLWQENFFGEIFIALNGTK